MAKRDRVETLRQLLIDARFKAGLTQSKVAERLGKPQSYVSKYENGERKLDIIDFLDVCEALSVEADEILEGVRTVRQGRAGSKARKTLRRYRKEGIAAESEDLE